MVNVLSKTVNPNGSLNGSGLWPCPPLDSSSLSHIMSPVKKKKLALLALFFVSASKGFCESAVQQFQDEFIQVAQKVSKAVVNVVATRTVTLSGAGFLGDETFCHYFPEFCEEVPSQRRKETGLGSGFVIDSSGHILTNHHVVAQADQIEVTFPGGKTYRASVVGEDTLSDIAVLSLKNLGREKVPAVTMGDSDKLRVGQWVLAVGNPFGNMFMKNGEETEPTVTAGVVSALHRSISIQRNLYQDLIQTDASINPGNSGGPLVNLQGEVIGINTAIFAPAGGNIGIGFAIPINRAKFVVQSLLEKGKVTYGFLGVALQEVDAEKAKKFGLKEREGAFVAQVSPNSPADQGGIKPGDIILNYNGKKVGNVSQIIDFVRSTPPGSKVKIFVWRKKKLISLQVTLTSYPETQNNRYAFRGLVLSDISPEVREKFNLREKEGVVVVEADQRSLAARRGIEPGDVIYQVDNEPIESLQHFKSYVGAHKDETLYFFLERGNRQKLIELPP